MGRPNTKEILAESFHELAAAKDIDKISIRDIVDNSGYSMATFYRHFKDKYDLIMWDYARKASRISEEMKRDGTILSHVMEDGARRFHEGKAYLGNLLLHTSGRESFVQYMTEVNYRVFLQQILKDSEPDKTTALLSRTYCLGAVALTCEWLTGRLDLTVEELAALYEDALPQRLRERMTEG